jgi:hypothetical protein
MSLDTKIQSLLTAAAQKEPKRVWESALQIETVLDQPDRVHEVAKQHIAFLKQPTLLSTIFRAQPQDRQERLSTIYKRITTAIQKDRIKPKSDPKSMEEAMTTKDFSSALDFLTENESAVTTLSASQRFALMKYALLQKRPHAARLLFIRGAHDMDALLRSVVTRSPQEVSIPWLLEVASASAIAPHRVEIFRLFEQSSISRCISLFSILLKRQEWPPGQGNPYATLSNGLPRVYPDVVYDEKGTEKQVVSIDPHGFSGPIAFAQLVTAIHQQSAERTFLLIHGTPEGRTQHGTQATLCSYLLSQGLALKERGLHFAGNPSKNRHNKEANTGATFVVRSIPSPAGTTTSGQEPARPSSS